MLKLNIAYNVRRINACVFIGGLNDRTFKSKINFKMKNEHQITEKPANENMAFNPIVGGSATRHQYKAGDYYAENGKQIELINCKECGKVIPKRYSWTTECLPCSIGASSQPRDLMREANDVAWELYMDSHSDADSGL